MSLIDDVSDLHIEDFSKDLAKVLIFLYEYFPRKMEIYVEDINGPDDIDDYGLHSKRHLACLSAIVWLAEEGLIRYESLVKQESFDQTVLTKRSYVLLSSIIKIDANESAQESSEIPHSVLRNRSTRIAQIKKAVKSGSSEAIKLTIASFIHDSENPDLRFPIDIEK